MSLPVWNEAAIEKIHDRKGFDCGQTDLNTFLAQHARQAHESSVSKTYVALDAADRTTIHGFYTLSPAQVEFHRVPDLARPKGGRYPVGGFRLGRLAVSKSLHGKGLGGQLLVAAAIRCMRASVEMGGTAMMIDAKDQGAAAWYRLYGAVPLNDAPLSLLLPYNLLKATLEAAGKPLALN
ncbi:GNAT family N-acetyltransferase [Rhizobium sp. LjRoot254]|uniref:GNAT family N-acetyltransferase n=1 Tax=Rhizobium sp. LjRoot254 TaxID=3342297 RepID=UPI003ED01219